MGLDRSMSGLQRLPALPSSVTMSPPLILEMGRGFREKLCWESAQLHKHLNSDVIRILNPGNDSCGQLPRPYFEPLSSIDMLPSGGAA